jgi:hypothetical protein
MEQFVLVLSLVPASEVAGAAGPARLSFDRRMRENFGSGRRPCCGAHGPHVQQGGHR